MTKVTSVIAIDRPAAIAVGLKTVGNSLQKGNETMNA